MSSFLGCALNGCLETTRVPARPYQDMGHKKEGITGYIHGADINCAIGILTWVARKLSLECVDVDVLTTPRSDLQNFNVMASGELSLVVFLA